ncbi:hypothetical protein J4H35_23380, partial [Vibrio alginolyticus]|nr:hypothetical protein [Vibrio alginolyticus]
TNGYEHNKAFKSDSQRLAFSLRSSIAKRCSHLNAALCALGENGYSRQIQKCKIRFIPHTGLQR